MAPPKAKPIYLATPYHNKAHEARVEGLLRALNAASGGRLGNRQVLAPHRAFGEPGIDLEPRAYHARCLEALDAAHVLLAILDGRQVDDGTAFAVGYAHAKGTPVVGVWTERRQVAHPHLVEACEVITGDVRELVGELGERIGQG